MLNINAPTAPQWEQTNEWLPQVHITGLVKDDAIRLQQLIDTHSKSILAHYLCSPLPETYSLELQFSDECEANSFLDSFNTNRQSDVN